MNYERNSRSTKKPESFIITRAKISAVRASGVRSLSEGGAALIRVNTLLYKYLILHNGGQAAFLLLQDICSLAFAYHYS